MNDTPLRTRLQLYRIMYLIRRTEEILMAEYHPADEMRCPMHFCVGHEAMPAALAQVLRRNAVLMSHYRSHAYYLAMGAPLEPSRSQVFRTRTRSTPGTPPSFYLSSHA